MCKERSVKERQRERKIWSNELNCECANYISSDWNGVLYIKYLQKEVNYEYDEYMWKLNKENKLKWRRLIMPSSSISYWPWGSHFLSFLPNPINFIPPLSGSFKFNFKETHFPKVSSTKFQIHILTSWSSEFIFAIYLP